MDVTDPPSIHEAATELDGRAIDLLLNNAGIIGPRGQTIGNIDYEAWAEVLAVNTMGPMRVSEAWRCDKDYGFLRCCILIDLGVARLRMGHWRRVGVAILVTVQQ